MKRLVQTIKRRLGCMKSFSKNNKLTIKEAISSIVHQLRICKQKTTYLIPFQAEFARKPNTSHSNISKVPKSSHLTYEQIMNHYLDTVPVQDYLNKKEWVSGDRSHVLIKEAMNRAHINSDRRYNSDKNKSVSHFSLHSKLINPIPRSQPPSSWSLHKN